MTFVISPTLGCRTRQERVGLAAEGARGEAHYAPHHFLPPIRQGNKFGEPMGGEALCMDKLNIGSSVMVNIGEFTSYRVLCVC